MLRSVRSLPTLRTLESTIQKDIKQQSKNFHTISSKYNLVVPNIPNNEMNISNKYQTFSRSVHQSSKTNSTPLFSNKNSEFSVMSLNSLKVECRKRGLKISGKKAELVSRISTYEKTFQSNQINSISTSSKKSKNLNLKPLPKLPTSSTKKQFTTTSKPQAKGDNSTIDYIKPVDISPPKLVSDDYIVKIPSLSTKASQTPVTELEKQLNQSSIQNPNSKIVSKADGSSTTIFESDSINKIDEQNSKALKTDVNDIYNGLEPEKPYEYQEGNISGNDKTIFAGVLAAIGGWWLLKPKKEKH
ncbi:hypothetical protein BN7_1459 [Wickerhamomyces ciferrii]|uniref:SAP domain-containing protein n=1 Tax=Wickerhamomyces ciferrii (strain ATCC 14091 / BCRC 22168 / CBS 111 / JCM 3599 / NBRC 0793 / NRRL Y-1031 F-60-10) TaxID=1206466 RepID=K0KAD7_WICCF|nr:uncharacterized protein BN7_1459 [Wickerhamomyces ciferrii]CCH41920.1 hypothetical protein BN7_1459 [Wickerhamomyces ciferrii]